MNGRKLTYDEKKAAEAAFRGRPFNPAWSPAARDVYDSLASIMLTRDAIGKDAGPEPASEPAAAPQPAGSAQSNPETETASKLLEEAGQAGVLIDVTPIAQSAGLNLSVWITRPLWDLGITASHTIQGDQYANRVRDILMALRLHLATSSISSPFMKFPALLSFPPEPTPQLCSLYAVVHKDPADPNSLTVLLTNEVPTLP